MNGQAPLSGISSMATRAVLADFAAAWQQQHDAVRIESVGGVDAARRVAAGEPFDFVVLADDALRRLGKQGHVDLGTRVEVAKSGIGIAVRAGTQIPDLASSDAVQRAVLAARRIGYSTGPSGVHLEKLFERWGIAHRVAPRLVKARPGTPVASLVARGDADLGFQQISELVNVPGIEIAAPLPAQIQLVTTFAAACTVSTLRSAQAQAFLDFIAAPAGDACRQRHGMEAPARA